jgi:dTDP-4-dehydrorhamnose 3,5-epimerase
VKVDRTDLPGVLILEPHVVRDERGFFYEAFNADTFAGLAADGVAAAFVQDNHSRSTERVLRGLHYQLRRPQGKLVTCVRGTIFDVAADIRVGSPTFGRWTGVTLDGDAPRYLWIPEGFAHGFCTLSPVADVLYKCTDLYAASDDHGVLWSDETLGIRWPIGDPITSLKDRQYQPLDPARSDLPRYEA